MKVCFVGVGSIAKRHIRNLKELCEQEGIALEIDALRRENKSEENIDHVYTNISELPSDYDVLFITNPTEYHAEMLMKLHNHAKHFFIEKPVTSLNTMKLLDDFKYRSDSVYYVACPLRYTSVIEYLKQNIDLNKVISVRSISSSYLPAWRPNVDYRETYSAKKELGGGVSIDLIHEWDYLTYLFGMPEDVKMMSGKVSGLEINSDDYAIYLAKYPKMICELHLDYFGQKTIREVELFLDDETILGDLVAGRVTYLKSGKIIDLSEERDAFQKKELRYFLELIKHGCNEDSDAKHALKVLKLTQGIID